MIKNKKILGLILARGGSKSIPKKNIRLLAGKPLLAYSIERGKTSHYIDRIICSTEDTEIAKIAKKFGAEVPFLRPQKFAQDNTPDLPPFLHALAWLNENEGYKPDFIVHLRPTQPLCTSEQIDRGIELLNNNPKADSLCSVSLAHKTPYKMFALRKNGFLKPILFVPGHENETTYDWPRQKLPQAYERNGYVDIARYSVLIKKKSMFGDKILPFIINERIIDIDSLIDWQIAEQMILQRDNLKK